MNIVGTTCQCGTLLRRFQHRCRGSGVGIWIKGCPQCDDSCPSCDTPRPNKVDHLCTVDEVIGWLMRIRGMHGGRIGVMLAFDGEDGAAAVPYLPVNEVAMDDDDPSAVVALLCVSEGNHPFGRIVRMRSREWEWRAE